MNEETNTKPGQATPESELYKQLIDPNIAKTELGWFVKKRIERLEALCRQLAGACEKTTWLLHRRALDPQEVTILVEMESALEAAEKAGITNG